MAKYLTKSRYLQGLQCRKRLWLSVNKPDLATAPDMAAQHIFDVGRRVGEYARLLFEEGNLVSEDHMHLPQATLTTQSLVSSGATAIFEAAAQSGLLLCRADVLTRDEGTSSEWDIHEVKMTAHTQEEQLYDLAFQRFCFEKAGYRIIKTFLLHINNQYVRHGDIDAEQLFVEEDLTQGVLERIPFTKIKAEEFSGLLESKVCPTVESGAHCKKPHECPFYGLCNPAHPDYSIYEL